MPYTIDGNAFTPLCAVCHEDATPAVRCGNDLMCEACAWLWGNGDDRAAVVEQAVRQAVQHLWPSMSISWGGVANTLQVLGYGPYTTYPVIGPTLRREIRNQFRQLTKEG